MGLLLTMNLILVIKVSNFSFVPNLLEIFKIKPKIHGAKASLNVLVQELLCLQYKLQCAYQDSCANSMLEHVHRLSKFFLELQLQTSLT